MGKKVLLASLIFLVGGAAAFPASVTVVDRTAGPDSPGQFEVTVENDQAVDQRFRVSVYPYSSWFYTDNARTVEPGEAANFSLEVTPPENTVQQNYRFNIFVKAGDGESREFTDYFSVERENDLVIRSVSSNANQVEPGENIAYTLEILNTAPTRVENYTIKASIHNRSVEKKGLPLSPGSTGSIGLEIPVSDLMPPGKTDVKISVHRDGSEKQSITQEVEVLRQRKIEREEESQNRILVYTRTLSATNNGNFRTAVKLNDTLPAYLAPITTVNTEPANITETDSGNQYTWSFELDPRETSSVSYTVNYWIPLAVLVVLLSGLAGLKRTRKQVRFTKTSKETDEGVKVHLELENKSSRPLHRVKVEDFIPDIASLKEEFPMARPVIRKTSNGTRLNWEIDELEPGDQRVFEYSIKPLLEVEGGVTLSGAELEADDRKISETGKIEVNFQPRET